MHEETEHLLRSDRSDRSTQKLKGHANIFCRDDVDYFSPTQVASDIKCNSPDTSSTLVIPDESS
jgi:hypothetical protein